jgi:hypothetical protein
MMAGRAHLVLPALAAALVAGCIGPYSEVGQKLDVGLRVTGGEAWIAAVGTDVHILVLGSTPDGASAQFAFSRLSLPIAAGVSSHALQGTWQEHGGTMFLEVQTEYDLADERSTALRSRQGARRQDDVNRLVQLDVSRSAGQLAVSGDPTLAGTYLPVSAALAHLGTTGPDDPACAFSVANLAVMTTQVRIIAFGGPGMLQYRNAQDFEGTIAGTVNVVMQGGLTSPDVFITFDRLQDFPGVQLDGQQHTPTSAGGDGTTEGTLLFTFQPQPVGGAPLAPITGSLEYHLTIANGTASGGSYTIAIDGGAIGTASPVEPPTPAIATCLGLP